MHKRGTKCIDVVIAIEGIIEVIRGVKVIEYSKIVKSDYIDYLFNIDIKGYFEDEIKRIKKIEY